MPTKLPPIPKTSESQTVAVSVRLPAALVAKLDAYAKREKVTRTHALKHILEHVLENGG